MKTAKYHVYVVRCHNGSLYTGHTSDLPKRIADHNSGRGGMYTRVNRPVSLLASWDFDSEREAIAVERSIKKLRQERKLALAETVDRGQDLLVLLPKRKRGSSPLVKPLAPCSRCGKERRIWDEDRGLCQHCHHLRRRNERTRAQAPAECGVCKQMRKPASLRRNICNSCRRKEAYGLPLCSDCKKPKMLGNLEQQLCKHCYQDRRAPSSFDRYVSTYDADQYSVELFRLFASTFPSETIKDRQVSQLRNVGKYLADHHFERPISWQAIEAALPPVDFNNKYVMNVRGGLLAIGHELARQGLLEEHDTFIERRRALRMIERAPEGVKHRLARFCDWQISRGSSWNGVRVSLWCLSTFWSWCAMRGVDEVASVDSVLINDFLLTRWWQWRCSECKWKCEVDPGERIAPRACPACSTLGSVAQARYYSVSTCAHFRAALVVFFDWARLSKLTLINPVNRRTTMPWPTIRHYSSEVVERLATHMADPRADPEDRVLLLLILVHALSPQELRHAQLPTLLRLSGDVRDFPLAEAYQIALPAPSPSLHRQDPGRPDRRIDLPASEEAWIKPLLERYETIRKVKVIHPGNRYLFVSKHTAKHVRPVSDRYLADRIKEISVRVTGVACAPGLLRKTMVCLLYTSDAADE